MYNLARLTMWPRGRQHRSVFWVAYCLCVAAMCTLCAVLYSTYTINAFMRVCTVNTVLYSTSTYCTVRMQLGMTVQEVHTYYVRSKGRQYCTVQITTIHSINDYMHIIENYIYKHTC